MKSPGRTIPRTLLAASLLLATYAAQASGGIVLTAQGHDSQFDPLNVATYSGTTTSAPVVGVSGSEYNAIASPSYLIASSMAAPSGVGYPSSEASISGLNISVDDSPALRALIAPGEQTLTLNVMFELQADIHVTDDPGLFKQSVVDMYASVYQHSITFTSASGQIEVLNGPYSYFVQGLGAMSGFNANGGIGFLELAVTLSPFLDGGLNAQITADISSFDLGLLLAPPSYGTVALGLPGSSNFSSNISNLGSGNVTVNSSPNFIQLQDGTSLASHGVTFSVSPTTASAATPEPATLVSAVTGILLVVAFKRRQNAA